LTIQGQAIGIPSGAAQATHLSGPLPPEIAFLVRHGVSMQVLRQAAWIADSVGVTAIQALIKGDLLDETDFYRALARELRLPFLPEPRLDERVRYPEAILAGLAPLDPGAGGSPRFAIAPVGDALLRLLSGRSRLGAGLAITTPTALSRAVLATRPRAVAWHAANDLPETWPEWSYRDGVSWGQIVSAAVASGTFSASATLAPSLTLWVVTAVAGLIFLCMVTLRLAAAREAVPAEPPDKPSRTDDQDLPTYTVVVALYRERRVLARLVEALTAFDYPAPKLDIKLVIEADDAEMREAFSAMDLPGSMEVIVAPPGAPRTKPRALNVALPLARGDYVTVYDAEDVPHPGQLRLAVETFARVPLDVACLQARLVIDNTEDSWVTRLFTIEYATLFDVINPGLSRLDMPVPLGGTSNHFRRSVLQRLGGWDAWSVTEDAELGIRLAVAGYRVADLPSATLEEAPATLAAWMKQRTRWMKGFMQVCVTHSRKPGRAWRSLGSARFFGAVTVTFGTAVAALGYPFFTILSIKNLVDGSLFKAETLLETMSSALGIILFVAGLVAIIVPAIVALHRRRWWALLSYVPLLPFYYVLISAAAWRGLVELLFDPFHWSKTEHGLARTSRTGMIRHASGDPEPHRPEDGRG
jgi:cellulose synthase/poly-beta-1,6-N-acetylglucosamine synthase-like glycosyltransferase